MITVQKAANVLMTSSANVALRNAMMATEIDTMKAELERMKDTVERLNETIRNIVATGRPSYNAHDEYTLTSPVPAAFNQPEQPGWPGQTASDVGRCYTDTGDETAGELETVVADRDRLLKRYVRLLCFIESPIYCVRQSF